MFSVVIGQCRARCVDANAHNAVSKSGPQTRPKQSSVEATAALPIFICTRGERYANITLTFCLLKFCDPVSPGSSDMVTDVTFWFG